MPNFAYILKHVTLNGSEGSPELQTLTPEQVKQMEEHAAATETQFRMNRALHRDGHLNDIEALRGSDGI